MPEIILRLLRAIEMKLPLILLFLTTAYAQPVANQPVEPPVLSKYQLLGSPCNWPTYADILERCRD